MLDRDMITVRNKKTGEQRTIPRAQFNNGEEPEATTGFAGIGNQLVNSLSTAPDALGEMITSIPGGMKKFGSYATSNNPVETLANLGAGGVESGVGLLSSPQVLMRYLAQKFPKFGEAMQRGAMPGTKGINDPTLYESLMNFEKEHGLGARSPEEATVRSGGGLLFGGGLLKNLPGMLSRTAAIASEQAGRGGDPVHAAILAMIGDKTGQVLSKGINKAAGEVQASNVPPAGTPPSPPGSPVLTANMASAPSIPSAYTTISNIPKAVYNVASAAPGVVKNSISAIPEVAANMAASGLETGADALTHIPGIGKIVQPTAGALGSYLKYLAVSPEEMAKRKLFGDIKEQDIPRMKERDEALKRAGILYGTPAELNLRPLEGAKQGTIGRTTGGMDELNAADEARTASEVKSVNGLLDMIYNGNDLNPQMKAAYADTMTGEVPPEFIEKHSKKPTIKAAMRKIEKDPAYQQLLEEEIGAPLGEVKPNNFVYWDLVKRALGDIEENKKETGKPTTTSSVYGRTRRNMVAEMDAIKPEYKVARNLSERDKTRKKVEKYFDKRPLTVNNLNKYLGSKRNYDELSQKLEGLPDAKQRLEDLHLIGANIIPSNMSVRAASALEKTSMSRARNQIDAAKRDLDEKFGQAHDVAAVRLMTNPDLMKILTEHLRKK